MKRTGSHLVAFVCLGCACWGGMPVSPSAVTEPSASPGATPSAPLRASVGAPAPQAGPLDQKLVVGDITISYPTGLEAQAKELAAVCETVIPPRKAKFVAAWRAFPDATVVVKCVTDLLGSPEQADWAEKFLANVSAGMAPIEGLFLPMFSDVRIYRVADLKVPGGVHGGIVQFGYDEKTDKAIGRIDLNYGSESPKLPEGKSFLPVVVRDDGTFKVKAGLADDISGLLDGAVLECALTLRLVLIHEVAEAMLVGMGFHHPFARWFNEGAANWVQIQVVAELAPEYLDLSRGVCLPGPPPDPVRDKINLLAWPQKDYQNDFSSDEEVDQASYRYATELVDRLLHGQPAGTLAKVVGKLGSRRTILAPTSAPGSPLPDSDAICQAFREVTGADAKGMLLEYVPSSIREGLKQDLPPRKLEEGYQALSAGRFSEAAKSLQEALNMSPSDADAHLNLAIAIRNVANPRSEQRRWLESQRHILIAAALTVSDPSRPFQLHAADDDEARYVLGRVEQMRGRTKEAREILSRLPKEHQDAQEALKEMAEEEKAPAAGPPEAGKPVPAGQ